MLLYTPRTEAHDVLIQHYTHSLPLVVYQTYLNSVNSVCYVNMESIVGIDIRHSYWDHCVIDVSNTHAIRDLNGAMSMRHKGHD